MSAAQVLELFPDSPLHDPLPDPPITIAERFDEFHQTNPHVFRRLRELARKLRTRGHTRAGMGMLFEVLRWNHMMRTSDPEDAFKLNNDFRSRYARLLMKSDPDLEGMFEVRELRSD